MAFERHFSKAQNNIKKHGVTFNEASQIFSDPFAISHQDRIENGEERWQTIGLVNGVALLLVAHTLTTWEDNDTCVEEIRIISARKADKKERRMYDNGHF